YVDTGGFRDALVNVLGNADVGLHLLQVVEAVVPEKLEGVRAIGCQPSVRQPPKVVIREGKVIEISVNIRIRPTVLVGAGQAAVVSVQLAVSIRGIQIPIIRESLVNANLYSCVPANRLSGVIEGIGDAEARVPDSVLFADPRNGMANVIDRFVETLAGEARANHKVISQSIIGASGVFMLTHWLEVWINSRRIAFTY